MMVMLQEASKVRSNQNRWDEMKKKKEKNM
jgi:hypothetical protein